MKIPTKLFGLRYVDINGVREDEFILIDTEEGGCAEYAHTFDPRGVLEALGDEEPGPADLPRYEIVALTAEEIQAFVEEQTEYEVDGAVYEEEKRIEGHGLR